VSQLTANLSPDHFHRLPPIPTGARHELPVPPPMRAHHSGPPPPPPVPARPGQPDLATRPFSAQGISYQNVETSPFPVPPPPPPIPPRIGQGGPSLSPSHAHPPGDVYGGFQNHGLHRPTSQLNLNASGSHSSEPWHSDASLQAQRRAQKEEEDRKAAEELRLEKERLRMEQEELHRQALALERLRQEEHERQLAAMEKIRKEQDDLARLKPMAKEEEERRLERERWAEEERVRRAKWEEEERIKRELEREQWRVEEEERNRRLRMEMADERFAAVFSMKEEMEAERLKQEAEEKRKAAEKAAEAEIARLKEEEERERQARLLQEKKDAEMARKLETTDEDDDQPSVNATTSHPSSTVQTPQQRTITDLPGYDQLQRPQVAVPPPSFEPQAINEQGDVHAPHMGRPHANTTANVSQPPTHLLPHNQSFPRLPAGMVNPNMPNGSSPVHYGMTMPPEHAQNPPAPIHAPTQHTGFPNAGTGQGPPYHNHFFPHREAENSPVSSPGGVAPHRTGPNKLQRPSNSVGGGNPTGRPPVHNNNGNPRPGTVAMPHPGHAAGSPSLPPITPPSSGRPSTANPPFATTPTDIHSSPGAGSSGQPPAPTPNPETSGHIVNEYPHGNASQQPIEPLSGISEILLFPSFIMSDVIDSSWIRPSRSPRPRPSSGDSCPGCYHFGTGAISSIFYCGTHMEAFGQIHRKPKYRYHRALPGRASARKTWPAKFEGGLTFC
jgi:hypothetical protein